MKSLLNQAFERRRENFVEQFKTDLGQHPGHAVLCLGARDGAEVAAMRSLGLLAIGIDLEYPDDNAFVHKGDFHNIPYPPDCFDYVYTNCFDHLFDVEKLMAEVQRIVRPATGRFVLDLPTDGALGGYESFGWQDKSDIETVLESIGWVVDDRRLRPDEAFWRYILVPPVEQAIKADVSS